MKSRGELVSGGAWLSRTLQAMRSVLHAPKVLEKASLRPGHPVQRAPKAVVPLGVLEEQAGCVRVRVRVVREAGTGS